MKKLLIVLGVVAAFLTATAFVTTEKANTLPGPGDGVTTCEVYGADGYTATVVEKVIVSTGERTVLTAKVRLNKKNTTGHAIKVVVQLRNSNNTVIENKTISIGSGDYGYVNFNHRAPDGEVFYITINSASCN